MKPSSPVESLASALQHATLAAMPAVFTRVSTALPASASPKFERVPPEDGPKREFEYSLLRRPVAKEIEVYAMFVQHWGSPSLGFGGLETAQPTDAYTIVLKGLAGDYAVYWNDTFAYLVPAKNSPEALSGFLSDIAARTSVARALALRKYGAKTP